MRTLEEWTVLKIIRKLLIIATMGMIVAFWVNLNATGAEFNIRFLLVRGGGSLLALGVLYKLLGRWDLVPDWIPLLGSIDDGVAWLSIFAGATMAGVGWYFL